MAPDVIAALRKPNSRQIGRSAYGTPETEKTGQVICWLVVLFVALAKETWLARDSTSPLNNIILVAPATKSVPATAAMPAWALANTLMHLMPLTSAPLRTLRQAFGINGDSRGARFIRQIRRRFGGENQKGGEKHQADTSPPDRVVRACPVSDIAGQRWSDSADR